MNPTLGVLLVVVFTACGRSPLPELEPFPLGEVTLQDSLVEVQVGAIGHCTRSRLGRVECEGTGKRDPDLRFTLVESGARAISVGGSFGYCGNHYTACALMDDDRVVCGTEGTHVCPSGRYEVQLEGVRVVALGGYLACVLNESGDVSCGDEAFAAPLRRIPGMANSIALSCGGDSCCSVHVDGSVSCIESGKLDSVRVSLATPAVAVSVGSQACAQDANGRSQCWDSLGSVRAPPEGRQVSAGGWVTCSIGMTGFAHCISGEEDLELFGQPLVQLDVGTEEVCAIGTDGTLHCIVPW